MQWAKVKSSSNKDFSKGFTIVELLIVVVVIAILAAITIVSYNGITHKAREVSVQTAVSQAVKKLAVVGAQNSDTYPEDIAGFEGLGFVSGDIVYEYWGNNQSDTSGYCVTATSGDIMYFSATTWAYSPHPGVDGYLDTQDVRAGKCPGHYGAVGPIVNLMRNPNLEIGSIGYDGANGTAFAIDNSRSKLDSRSLRLTLPATVNRYTVGASVHQSSVGPGAILQPGKTYTVSAYVYVPPGTTDVQLRAQGATADPEGSPTDYETSVKGEWVNLHRTFTVGSSGTVTIFILNKDTISVANTNFWVDGVMLVEGDTRYAYSDGESSRWSWQDDVNFSISTGPSW